jgi:hypothetical protein
MCGQAMVAAVQRIRLPGEEPEHQGWMKSERPWTD